MASVLCMHIRNLAYKVVPCVFGFLFVLALTVAAIYSWEIQKPIPTELVVVAAVLFSVVIFVDVCGLIMLYFLKPRVQKADVEHNAGAGADAGADAGVGVGAGAAAIPIPLAVVMVPQPGVQEVAADPVACELAAIPEVHICDVDHNVSRPSVPPCDTSNRGRRVLAPTKKPPQKQKRPREPAVDQPRSERRQSTAIGRSTWNKMLGPKSPKQPIRAARDPRVQHRPDPGTHQTAARVSTVRPDMRTSICVPPCSMEAEGNHDPFPEIVPQPPAVRRPSGNGDGEMASRAQGQANFVPRGDRGSLPSQQPDFNPRGALYMQPTRSIAHGKRKKASAYPVLLNQEDRRRQEARHKEKMRRQAVQYLEGTIPSPALGTHLPVIEEAMNEAQSPNKLPDQRGLINMLDVTASQPRGPRRCEPEDPVKREVPVSSASVEQRNNVCITLTNFMNDSNRSRASDVSPLDLESLSGTTELPSPFSDCSFTLIEEHATGLGKAQGWGL